MATQAEIRTVNVAALTQGIALVTFPAASTIFTAADGYHLSGSQYGALFAPQVVLAIAASLLGSRLSARFDSKGVYLAGLLANLASMALLLISRLVMTNQALAFPLLLAATACLGAGFGLAVPILNTFTAVFHPQTVDQAVLALNALLGLGTALAPLLVAVFVGLGFWVGLPLLVVALLVALLMVSLRLPFQVEALAAPAPSRGAPTPGQRPVGPSQRRPQRAAGIPAQFWVFAGFAMLYGFCETINGNWSQVDLTANLGLSATVASLALTVFWAVVTLGRVMFAAVQGWFPSRLAYHLLPFVLAVAFLIIAGLPPSSPAMSVLAFALAGLGCSALLPLTISFGQEKLVSMAGAVAGGVIAFYQFGYGIASFGVGPLLAAGVALPAIFAASAVMAVVMGVLSFVVAHRRPSPVSLHPRPAPLSAVASP
jgi:MFS family permease